MRKFAFILLCIFLLSALFLGCNSRKDETTDKAILNYMLSCGPGGTIESCNASCSDRYGATVTSANLQALNSCTSACATNCNLVSLFLTYSSLNK
ncbi:hypothetical protein EHQ12_07265 [Leptospira gomenensis]|uniref:Lipoprotein n=1 Tax=Leptospira gomenensis TaxID=2484974 RepID=A0A5F1YCV8_9LEPT|nr:hypothetical protein [Leptospira gomenensis]TGK35597.1 hypothetical protein EHQ17_06050 [Leptospira gomenensis]TGK40676.1 hypothetical protein EHQ12_07265 [Leptospira gomenensis]TGK46367.1 hypothetical protein EHQ07_06435 [Leptospira gomenensis]TGK66486.1 hypothetical protein EHQ13_02840 [Leptospira gomenensis]